jgi:uncharacterized protein (DUF1501 family)
MKRRDFLKVSQAAAVPFLLNNFPIDVAETNPLLQLIAQNAAANGRVLVIIQLNGGNDGLNTVIPLNQYSALTTARGNVLIPQASVLALSGQPNTGFHPSMPEMRNLYNNQLLNVVQGVSYPNPNFSHFRATDIWFTGSRSDQYLQTGWLGRYLESDYPGYPVGYPNADMPDPLSIQIGSQASIMTQGSKTNMCMTVSDPNYFYNLVNGITDPAPPTPYGHELTYIRLVKQQTNAYTTRVKNAYTASATQATYPANNWLAEQLKIVARLIKGGLKTPVYVVNHPDSFDTHSNQVDASDKTKGVHADSLSILSKAADAFQNDLKLMGVENRVVTATFTEFGRRIKSNNSTGTDHGSSTPMFFFGTAVNPTIVGVNPQIPANATPDDNLPMQYDFRAVYYTILKEWFQLTTAQLTAVLTTTYPIVPIFEPSNVLPVTLVSFSGKWKNADDAELTWMVEEESNIAVYEVMRSVNGSDFEKIGVVSAINSQSRHSYSFTDVNLKGFKYFYRLRIVEKNDSSKFSEVVPLSKTIQQQAVKMKVLPNPIQKVFTLSFESKVSGVLTVRILSMAGQEVWKQVTQVSDVYNITMNLGNKTIAAGAYMMHVVAGSEEGMIKVMVQ